jgi:hypothetical protein
MPLVQMPTRRTRETPRWTRLQRLVVQLGDLAEGVGPLETSPPDVVRDFLGQEQQFVQVGVQGLRQLEDEFAAGLVAEVELLVLHLRDAHHFAERPLAQVVRLPQFSDLVAEKQLRSLSRLRNTCVQDRMLAGLGNKPRPEHREPPQARVAALSRTDVSLLAKGGRPMPRSDPGRGFFSCERANQAGAAHLL